ncbi:hypothetical protein MNBD_GAMMA26-1321, partial [hydrothermal vent metagenome]
SGAEPETAPAEMKMPAPEKNRD